MTDSGGQCRTGPGEAPQHCCLSPSGGGGEGAAYSRDTVVVLSPGPPLVRRLKWTLVLGTQGEGKEGEREPETKSEIQPARQTGGEAGGGERYLLLGLSES